MHRIYISIICFVFTITDSLNAQLVTTHYGLQEGLPSSETFFGYQDDSNYLWFTTDRGVVKYDGYEFKTFTTNNGLAELVNLKILRDPAGGFVMMGKGSQITFYRDGNFTAFKHNNTLNKLSESIGFRLDILDISESNILLNDLSFRREFYYEINRLTGKVNRIHATQLKSISWSNLSTINIDLDTIYSTNEFVIIHQIPTSISDYHAIQYQYSKHQYTINLFNNKTTRLPLGSKFGYHDSKGNLWYSHDQKLYCIKNDTKEHIAILDNEISSVLEDTEGNIWAMSPANGLFKLKVNNLLKSLNIKGFDNSVVDIYDVQSMLKLYTRSHSQYYRYNIKDTILYSEINQTAYIIKGRFIVDSIKLNENFNFNQIDSNLNILKNFHSKSEVLNYSIEQSCFIIEKYGGIHVLNSNNNNIKTIEIPYVYDFEEVSGLYLFGTSEGLKIGRLQNYDKCNLNIIDTTFIHNRINDLDKGVNGDVWIATLERGIYRYKNGNIHQIVNPFHSFLSINTIEVLDSIAFIGTSTGLNKITYKILDDSVIVKDSQILGLSEGLSPPYVKSIEIHKNHIYLGTLNGILTFHADSFNVNESIPKMYLQGLYQKNEKIISANPLSYELGNQNNFFTIKYTGISFAKDPVMPFYRYSFQSSDSTQWIYTHSRELNFSDLAPGNYKFVVQCRNNANDWSEPASLFVNIQPPFFQTWTFRIGSLLILGGFIWTFFYFRNRRLKRQQAMKNEILSVQMQSTRSQMNPHFVFNGMNAIQNFIFSNDKEGANRYITTFSSLLRDSLQLAGREYISLDREIRFVDRYLSLEKNRFPDKFDYKITVSTDIPEEKVLVPTLMVQTLAENAVKHAFKGMSKKGTINIHYYYNHDQNQLTIKIVDDGIGLLNQSLDQEDDSRFGLNLLKRRIDIYNQRSPDNRTATVNIDYLDAQNKIGTIISLNIPLYEKSH